MNGVALRNALDLLLDDAGKNRSEEAGETWGGLIQLVQNNCQLEEDLALVASVLLAREDSLLQFLVKSVEQQGGFHGLPGPHTFMILLYTQMRQNALFPFTPLLQAKQVAKSEKLSSST